MPRILQKRPSSAGSRQLEEEEEGDIRGTGSLLFEKESMQALRSAAVQESDEIEEERRETAGEAVAEEVGQILLLGLASD